jgi:hypothetical protein
MVQGCPKILIFECLEKVCGAMISRTNQADGTIFKPSKADVQELARFLVRAKVQTYAGNQREMDQPQRPGFKELVFKEGRWEYRDSYLGFYSAPGTETVMFDGRPVWAMSYSGTMDKRYYGDEEFASRTFAFLRRALSEVTVERPFRGPNFYFMDEDGQRRWTYLCNSHGSTITSLIEEHLAPGASYEDNCTLGIITGFVGKEVIQYDDRQVFVQDFVGGLIVPKTGLKLRV